jgi:hypothetical protein
MHAKHGKDPYGHGPYELAIVPHPDNPETYTVMYDFIGGGYGLEEFIGKPVNPDRKTGHADMLAPKLVQHYRMCADAISAAEAEDSIEFEEQPDGSWVSYTRTAKERMRA